MEKNANKNSIDGFNAENSRNGDAHLSDEQIIEYRYGIFASPEIEQSAQNHLIECRRCIDLLLELNGFAESTAAISASSRIDADAQWAQFAKKRLTESKPANLIAAAKTLKPEKKPAKNFFGFLPFNFATAAAFGVLTIIVGAGIFLALRNNETNEPLIAINTPPIVQTESAAPPKIADETGEQKIAQDDPALTDNSKGRIFKPDSQKSSPLNPKTKDRPKDEIIKRSASPPNTNKTRAPQDESALNAGDFSLYPNEALRGTEEDIRRIRVKQTNAGQIRLKLNAPKGDRNLAFSVEVTDSRNKFVLRLPILPDKRGDFYLIIPARKLPAAVYALRIYVEEKNARKVFAEYGFELEYE